MMLLLVELLFSDVQTDWQMLFHNVAYEHLPPCELLAIQMNLRMSILHVLG